MTSDGAARSMSVSARARLPTRSACWKSDVEGGADGADLLAGAERLAGLAEDLALAERHRVEAGGDLEQVRDRAVVVVDVEVRQHRLGALAGPVDEQPGDLLDAAVEAVDVGVDLEPVAGRDDRRLGDVLAARRRRRSACARRRASSATRSSSATGAELWEMPTTRTLIGAPRSHGPSGSSRCPWALRCSW